MPNNFSLELYYVIGAVLGVLFLVLLGAYFVVRSRRREPLPPPVTDVPADEQALEALEATKTPAQVLVPRAEVPAEVNLSERLARTRGSLIGRLGKFLGVGKTSLPPEEWEQMEEILLEGDVGVQTTRALLGRIQERQKSGDPKPLRELVEESGESLLAGLNHGFRLEGAPKPLVISIVGVNGAGKTTTIGKLAHRFKSEGREVLLGAGDTFRAAAISQLKVWADRAQAQFVTGREGADPGAVAFDSVTAGKARDVDFVILDTAGRLHTKTNLMDELKKVHRVMKKVIPEAPHEVWLVLDGTTGQNAVQQAKVFSEALELTGVVITKLDGTAKGGAILAVASQLKLPIKFIGVGEGIEDLIPFEPKPFVQAILGTA